MQRKVREFGMALACFASLQSDWYVVAQGPTQTGAGPTMQQTVEFIQGAMAKQGHVRTASSSFPEQSIVVESDCSWKLLTVDENHVSKARGVIDLAHSNISSLKIIDNDGGFTQLNFQRAAFVEAAPAAKQNKGFTQMGFGVFQEKDVAERVAKALIHAMVLCHKDDKPSLF